MVQVELLQENLEYGTTTEITRQLQLEHIMKMLVEFNFIDTGFEAGVNAYWVRVVQSDGEMAWSSPIYVNRVS